jgi:protein-tyrosine phosphatase
MQREKDLNTQMMQILVVCTANICRSPMGQGVLESMLAGDILAGEAAIDSAGTHKFRVGQPPDKAAQAEAAARGIDISQQRSREVVRDDFERFDLILAMDRQNLDHLRYLCASDRRERIKLFMEFAGGKVRDVPDPFGRKPERFANVMDLIEVGAQAVVPIIRAHARS